MSSKVTVGILDYGIGNVKSMANALERIGATPLLTRIETEILNADALIFPGVGAFAKGMNNINEFNLRDLIFKFVETGKPFLGVCLGMQLLLDESDEFGTTPGLGLIKGRVTTMPLPSDSQYKLPHISWNGIHKPTAGRWDNTILAQTPENADVYFVHTFVAMPNNPEDVLATAEYGGTTFCSAIQHKNIYGVQFHPEKSGEVGLNILRSFVSLIEKK